MPPKPALKLLSKPSPRLRQLLDSLVRLGAHINEAGPLSAVSPHGNLSELYEDLDALASIVGLMSRDIAEAFIGALEGLPEVPVALAKILLILLRAVVAAQTRSAATPSTPVASGGVASGKHEDTMAGKPSAPQMLRALHTAVAVSVVYVTVTVDIGEGKNAQQVRPAGVASFTEALLRADFFPAMARFLAVARDRPPHFVEAASLAITLTHTISCAAIRDPETISLLVGSLRGSGMVEVWARVAAEGVWRTGSTRGSLLHNTLRGLEICGSSPVLRSYMRALHSGPCLQYWTALQAVSQLHAADGGTLYGLPPVDLLPPEWAADKGLAGQHGQAGQQRQAQRFLSCSGIDGSLDMWMWCLDEHNSVPLGPLRPRALRSLALRTARAALASCELHDPGLAGAVEAVRWRGSSGMPQQAQQAALNSGEGSGRDGVGSSGEGPGGSSCGGSGGQRSSRDQRQGQEQQEVHGSHDPGGERSQDEAQQDGSGASGSTCGHGIGSGGGTGGGAGSSSGDGRAGSGSGGGTGGEDRCSRREGGSGGQGGRQRLGPLQHSFQSISCTGLALKALYVAQGVMEAPKTDPSRRASGAAAKANSSRQTGRDGFGATSSSNGSGGAGGGASTAAINRIPDVRLRDARFASRWWPLVVRAVWAGLRRPGGFVDAVTAGELVAMLRPWELRAEHDDGLGVRLPASPPPGLSSALSSGLIPTTEAYLRTIAARTSLSSSPSPTFTPALDGPIKAPHHTSQVLDRISGTHLVLLLAHGDPMQGAALLTTLAKAALRQAELAARAGAADGAFALVRAATRIMYDMASAVRVLVGQEEQATQGSGSSELEERAGTSVGVVADLATEGRLTSDVVGKRRAATAEKERIAALQQGCVGGVAVDQAGSTVAGRSPAEQQLLRLWCFALPRWLPVLARLSTVLEEVGRGDKTPEQDELWRALMTFNAEMMKQAAAACRGAWQRGDMRAVASCRGLLQRDVCVVNWMGTCVTGKWEAEEWWSAPLLGESQQQQQHQKGSRGRAAGGGGNVGSAASSSSSQGGEEAVIKTYWPFLLPLAPCEAASLLPTCSNPLCTQLQGDSEVEVQLGVGAGVIGAAGSPNYCTSACRLAHKQLQQQHKRQAEERRRQHKVFASRHGGNSAAGTERIMAMIERADLRPVMRGL